MEHLLTAPYSPTTTGKIERFHRTLRAEFDTRRVFTSLKTAQQALDEWVEYYNTSRPHQSLDDATPASRFLSAASNTLSRNDSRPPMLPVQLAPPDRSGQGWVTRKVAVNGVVCVDWQQVSVGKHRAGQRCDVLVTDQLLQFWIGSELLKTVARTSTGIIRKKNAAGTGKRR